jgi:hypothetical protein
MEALLAPVVPLMVLLAVLLVVPLG